ncbi:uncharacterized protein DAT39_013781 [Clarias magur]|uniref:Uncharacterized protein n=1 Tax=Clarias magur TaxID=1594786 RepID=A0A8J4TVU0_CLAMG|nr:uncharacterized protein DAT39_013781 [Clarias magur]
MSAVSPTWPDSYAVQQMNCPQMFRLHTPHPTPNLHPGEGTGPLLLFPYRVDCKTCRCRA